MKKEFKQEPVAITVDELSKRVLALIRSDMVYLESLHADRSCSLKHNA